MYNQMIEAIKEETVQLLFHIDLDSIAQTNDDGTDSIDDAAVDSAEIKMGDDVSEDDELNKGNLSEHEPE